MGSRKMTVTPWQRLSGESEEAYAAFVTYRDLGRRRSIAGVNQECTGGAPKSLSILKRWSSKYRWSGRCLAWDIHLQAQRDNLLMADARKWERRRLDELEAAWQDVQALRQKARNMLDFPLATKETKQRDKDGVQVTTVKPSRWTMGQAAMMLRLAAEIGAAIGEATAKDPADMTDAELIGIEEAIGNLDDLDTSAA